MGDDVTQPEKFVLLIGWSRSMKMGDRTGGKRWRSQIASCPMPDGCMNGERAGSRIEVLLCALVESPEWLLLADKNVAP